MSQIYTAIDLGSHSIKVVVASRVKRKFHVLASSSSPSKGIRKGHITDTKSAIDSVKKCVVQSEEMLGLKIKKAVVCVPTDDIEFTIVTGKVDVIDSNCITGEDIVQVLKEALLGQVDSEHELITIMPIHFTVGEELVKDPKGFSADTLGIKAVITTIPKEPLYRILEVVKLSGIETVDIAFHAMGDYFEVRNTRIEQEVGAVINIGEESTNVSIFNKGIMIKNSIVPVGSHFIDKDITYVYKVDLPSARQLKETFATSVVRYADANDVCEISLSDNETKEIRQVELSKVVESRVYEILKLVKKELKTLTNREIRYIIITGGLSELAGFQYAVEDILGRNARVCNITTMGVRHNKFSSALGLLKYYNNKLELRGKRESMFSEFDFDLLLKDGKQEITNDHIINKVFGHFFDN